MTSNEETVKTVRKRANYTYLWANISSSYQSTFIDHDRGRHLLPKAPLHMTPTTMKAWADKIEKFFKNIGYTHVIFESAWRVKVGRPLTAAEIAKKKKAEETRRALIERRKQMAAKRAQQAKDARERSERATLLRLAKKYPDAIGMAKRPKDTFED